MSLRNKLAAVLEANSTKCLDDPDDVLVVLEALVDAFTPGEPLEFAQTCEVLYWYVNTGTAPRDLHKHVRLLLTALGEE